MRPMIKRVPTEWWAAGYAMLEVYKAIGRVAPQDVTVLIRGESGTGKELVARAIYQHSLRSGAPFLAVNCAAIPEALLESELFGHEKGSFTGADRQRIGKFEQCSGGTIFLDEIGDMSPLVQGKLLRLLQEQRFERVGGNQTIQTDVRIITATHRDLESMSSTGTFRADLYYRLNGYTIAVPPLRKRGDDIVLLFERLFSMYARQLRKDVQGIAPDALKLLVEYPWPGNIREMQTALRSALLKTNGPVLVADSLPDEIRNPTQPEAAGSNDAATGAFERMLDQELREDATDLYDLALAMMDRRLLTRILTAFTSGNQSHASRILGITRSNLRNKNRVAQDSGRQLGRSRPRIGCSGFLGIVGTLRDSPSASILANCGDRGTLAVIEFARRAAALTCAAANSRSWQAATCRSLLPPCRSPAALTHRKIATVQIRPIATNARPSPRRFSGE